MKKNDAPCVQKTITGFIARSGSQIFHRKEPKMTDANKLLERAAILLRKTKTFSGVALAVEIENTLAAKPCSAPIPQPAEGVVVPREPTEEILEAMRGVIFHSKKTLRQVYRAVLLAAAKESRK